MSRYTRVLDTTFQTPKEGRQQHPRNISLKDGMSLSYGGGEGRCVKGNGLMRDRVGGSSKVV